MNEWRRGLIGIALALGLAALPGCGSKPVGRNAGNVTLVQRGWTPGQVRNKIGPPLRVREGEWLELGQEEWIYPAGSVIFKRMMVTETRRRRPGDPIPQTRRSDIDVYSRHPFGEDDEYYALRETENRRREARFSGLGGSLQPARSREEIERDRQWREDDRASREGDYRALSDYY